MSAWEQSEAAARLRAVGGVAVGSAPPLHAVRQVAEKRARRAAQLMAFAVAIPLGAMAAAGTYAWKHQGHEERTERSKGRPLLQRAAEPVVMAQIVALPVAIEPVASPRALTPALAPRAEKGRGVARPALAAVVVPPATPEIPATAAVPGFGGSVPRAALERTSLADESATLTEALTALRREHDAARALELLTTYQARFPGGALRREAALAMVEAHRALGHTAEALAALDDAPRRADLDVLRAELNAELGQCEPAREALRGLQLNGDLRERALFTDATCALSLGERDQAIADLRQLPESPRARALLEKLE